MALSWLSRRRVGGALGSLLFGLAVLSGCGGDNGDESRFTPVAGSDSAYCDTYRAWKVYELDRGEGFDQPNPAALRRYWNEYLITQETLLREAPPEIRAAVEVKLSVIRTRLTPLLEKYDFNLRRIEREGAAAEQALLVQPPPQMQKAQEAQYAYEDRTCGTAPSPPPADVVFEADASSKAFCAALSVFNRELDKVAFSRFDPDVLRAFVAGDRFSEVLDALDAAAPAEIAEDVRADSEWFRTRWSDVVAQYDYDLRRIYLDGTPEDLAVFNRSPPVVVEHASRTTAFEDQLCGG
jgi:hypothetical protein